MTPIQKLLAGAVLSAVALSVQAATFKVEDIRVEGLQRITAGTVFNYLPVKPGQTIDEAETAGIVRELFKTGFFKDVRLERQGDVLIVSVDERPAIAELTFSGNKSIPEEALREGLKGAGLAEGRTFDQSVLDNIQQELERQFFNQGKYSVTVETVVTPLERNRVGIAIDIVEGDTARIKQINIVGNQAFDEEDLLDMFDSKAGSWTAWLTNEDQYSRPKLSGDLEKLRSHYLDRGYIKFKIDSTQVSITPDKKDIYITINVSEGDIYRLKDIQLAGEYVGDTNEYFPLIQLRRGEAFNRKEIVGSSDRVSALLADKGYAFANVNAIPDINEDDKTVVVTYFVDPGKRVYVRRLNIRGNTRTRDEVVRREFRQMESAWFSSEKLKLSKERVNRTGYFQKVNVATPTVPGQPDQVDVNVDLEELPAGQLVAGLGYSQADGVAFNAAISQDNFIGTGKKVSLAFKTASAQQEYTVAYTNPYYTVDGVSRGFTFSHKATDFAELDSADYKIDDTILGVNFGIPLTEFNRFSFSSNLHFSNFEKAASASTVVTDWQNAEGTSYTNLDVAFNWTSDDRDSALMPTSGSVSRLSAEATVPGSTLGFYKAGAKHRRYWPMYGDLVFSLNGEVGYGDSYGGTSKLPFYENYYIGGPSSVRGYAARSIGPREDATATGDPIGGNFKLLTNAEFYVPSPVYSDTMRLVAFADAGTVMDTTNDVDWNELRYSTGVGLAWMSPVGPLTLSYAKGLKEDSQDELESFQFTLGTVF